MGDSLVYKLRSGKPPKFIYFAYDMLKMAIPSYFYRMQLKRTIAQLSNVRTGPILKSVLVIITGYPEIIIPSRRERM